MNNENVENIENNYTVYMHKNKINNKVYIGITGVDPEKRWGSNGSKYNHNNYFKNAIQKYGWDNFEHIILYKNLTKLEAENIEVELIKQYNATNKDCGYNIQNGGNSIGRMTDEIKRKIGLANSKPVYQYDKNTGDFINEYCSASEAGRILKISHETITAVCNKTVKTIGGYIFRYKTDKLIYGEKLIESEFCFSSNTHKRAVVQYSKIGEYIAEYPSIKDAELAMGKDKGKTLILHCCNGKKSSALGYIWCYKGESCIVNKSNRQKQVDQFDENGNLIKTFDSVKEAASSIGKPSETLIKTCKQEDKILCGYIWKYAS